MGMKVELITLSPDDWQTWRSTRLAALTEAPSAFGSRLEDWADADERRWRDRLSIPGAVNLVALDPQTNTPVGMVTGTPPAQDSESAKVISMWVDPTVRGQGVATSLITAVANWAANSGARALTLSVMPNNEAARRVYERNGFEITSELDDGSEIEMTRVL